MSGFLITDFTPPPGYATGLVKRDYGAYPVGYNSSEADNVERVELAFDCMGAVIKTTKSKTGKFTSISIDVTMKDSQEIVDKYLEVSTIKGIISL